MKRLIIIPLLFILLSVQGQNGRYPFYRGVTAAGGEQTAEEILASNTLGWYVAAVDNFTIVNDSISQWDDISGNNRHLEQGTQFRRPQYLNSDSVYFDGDDQMETIFSGTSGPVTAYIVCNVIGTKRGEIMSFGSGFRFTSTWSDSYYVLRNSINFETPVSSAIFKTWVILTVQYNGENTFVQVNNGTLLTGTVGDSSVGRIAVSLLDQMDMSVKEIIVRMAADDETTRGIIVDYLNDEYSIF